MIGAMRQRKGGVGVWVIMGLLFVGLVGFGIGGTGAITTSSIGVVGDTQIPIPSYVSTLNQTRQQIALQIGRMPTGTEMVSEGILDAVVEDAVRATALDDLSASLGISVGDEAIRQTLLSDPSFVASDGTFNNTAYQFFLEQNGLSASQYEELIRRSSARLLIERIVQNGIEAPSVSADAIVTYALESRDVAWIELREEDLAEPVAELGPEAVREFYDNTPGLFVQPETKQITYAWLTPSRVTGIEIDEDTLRATYEEQLANRYTLPERRAIERLIFADPTQADDAKARLDAGELTFEELVVERGLTVNDIDMGIVEADAVEGDARDSIFADIEPGIFGPFQSDLGAELYNVSAVLNAQVIPFDEAVVEIREDLEGTQRSDVINNLVTELDDLLAAGATLEEVAAETPLTLAEIAFNSESEGGISAYLEFREAAQRAQEGDFPELFTLSDGGVFALRVDDVTPPGTKPFEEVEEQAQEAAQANAVREALLAEAEALTARIEAGEGLFSLGYASSAVADLRRAVPTNDFNFIAITRIFEGAAGSVFALPAGDAVQVIQVEEVNLPDLTDEGNADVTARVQAELTRNMSADILLTFADAVADDAGVQLDFNVINQVNAQALGLTAGTGFPQ
ncbi:MAG: SurA N-terminal domain-containing protein [Pseudomonadota bacterium]